MTIGGLILLILGIISAMFGNTINSDMDLKMQSLVRNGNVNPGNDWLYIGIAVAAIGLILFIAGLVKKNRQ